MPKKSTRAAPQLPAESEQDPSVEQIQSLVPTPGRYSYDGLQRAFHEKARLGIMTSLLSYPNGLSFSDLKELCSLSDGNLNRHIEVLKEESYIDVQKSGAGRKAKTICKATKIGRSRFLEYIAELQKVVSDAAVKVQVRESNSTSSRYGTT